MADGSLNTTLRDAIVAQVEPGRGAGKKLEAAIAASVAAGEKIAPPDAGVMLAVEKVAQMGYNGVTSDANTREAVERATEAHIKAAGRENPVVRKTMFEAEARKIKGPAPKHQERANNSSRDGASTSNRL